MNFSTENLFDTPPDQWLDAFGDYLYQYARLRVSRKEIAEDLVQDVFVSAWKSKDGFKGNSSVKTWLVSIMKNKIIDHYRKKGNRAEVLEAQKQLVDETDKFFREDGPNQAHWTTEYMKAYTALPEAENQIQHQEFMLALASCLEGLPERSADVFKMKFLDELDVEEICKVSDITPSNYWVIVHRAKLKLRDCLSKNWLNQ